MKRTKQLEKAAHRPKETTEFKNKEQTAPAILDFNDSRIWEHGSKPLEKTRFFVSVFYVSLFLCSFGFRPPNPGHEQNPCTAD